MRWAIVGLILLGVLAATCAALLVGTFSKSGRAQASKAPIEIIVASKALPAATYITAECVTTRQVQKSEAPARHFTDAVEVVGRTTIIRLAEGQALTADCFGDKERENLASKIPDDMVASNIMLADSSSIDNILYPGCLVDVIFTYRPSNPGEMPTARTILQGKLVLAIDDQTILNSKPQNDGYVPAKNEQGRKVTLQLTPRESKQLQLAQSSGTISLALRNPSKKGDNDGESVSLNSLLGKSDPMPAPPPVQVTTSGPAPVTEPALSPNWKMDVIQGGKKETRSFPIPGPDDTTHDDKE